MNRGSCIVNHKALKSWTHTFHYFLTCFSSIILVNLRVTWQIAENQMEKFADGKR